MVGFEIQVFILIGRKGGAQVQHAGTLADGGKNIVQHCVFIHHCGTGGQLLGVDDTGRGGQQKRHLAGVRRRKIADGLHILGKLFLRGTIHSKKLREHPMVFAQQNAALFGFLENDLIRRALGVHPDITQRKLILHPAGKSALPAAVQQRRRTERGELRGLAVLEFQLVTLGEHQVHQRKTEHNHRAQNQQRIGGTVLFFFAVHNFCHLSVPPFRNWRTALLHWLRPLRRQCTAAPAGPKQPLWQRYCG